MDENPPISPATQEGSSNPRPPASPLDTAEILRGLIEKGTRAMELAERPGPPSVKPPKVRYTHEAMVELILTNPWISQGQLAAHFGYSQGWISTILTSDAFQAKLAARREELIDPELRATLQERFTALTAQSLRILQEKLSKPADQVPDNLALRAAELGAKALGIGGNAPAQQVVLTSEERLAGLAHRLIALRGAPSQQVIDV